MTVVTDLKEFQRYKQSPFSDERPLLVTLEFFEIGHGSYQSMNFLPSHPVAELPLYNNRMQKRVKSSIGCITVLFALEITFRFQ